MRRDPERVCLLVEGTTLRPVLADSSVHVIIETPRSLAGLLLPERIWRHHGERDLISRCRIFREELPPPPPEPAENPLYDELYVHVPLPGERR